MLKKVKIDLLLAFLLLSSFVINIYNYDLPVGYHPDEVKKAVFVKENTQDFQHPILLLQSTKLITANQANQDPEKIILQGRTVSAIAGVVIVLAIFLIARLKLSRFWSLLIATAVASSPIIVIHAHYMKEDILFTAMSLVSLYFFGRYWQEKFSWKTLSLFGLFLGLALSSHYKSLLLIPFFLLLPILKFKIGNWLLVTSHWLKSLAAFILASLVFLSVNYPIFTEPQTFWKGFNYETNHATTGHDLTIRPFDHYFTWHLTESLWPGMTPPLLIACLLGIITIAGFRHKLSFIEKSLLLYGLVYYIAMEMAPLKPFPDFSRYVIPVVPALIYAGVLATRAIMSRTSTRWRPTLLTAAISIFIAIPAADTVALAYFLDKDTRNQAEACLDPAGWTANTLFEAYTRQGDEQVWSNADNADDIPRYTEAEFKIFALSSFQYQRYFAGSNMPDQNPKILSRAADYQQLLSQYPHTIINPTYRTFAFSNPQIVLIGIANQTQEEMDNLCK